MAHLTTNTHSSVLSAVVQSIVSGVKAYIAAQRSFREYKGANSRSDDELARMGLTYGKIASYVLRDETRR